MPEGLYIFQLIEKEETPTFEALAEQFEADWDAFYEDVMNPKPEETGEEGESQDIEERSESQDIENDESQDIEEGDEAQDMENDESEGTTEEAISDQQSEVSNQPDSPEAGIEHSPGTESGIESQTPKAEGDTPDTDEDQTVEPDESESEAESETTSNPSEDDAASEDADAEEDAEEEADAEDEEEELKVYRKHGFRGRWEDPSAVASDAQRLYAGEYSSRPIQTKKSFRLIKVDKKRTYRGDIYFYGGRPLLLRTPERNTYR